MTNKSTAGQKELPTEKLAVSKTMSRKEIKGELNKVHERSAKNKSAREAYTKRKAHVALLEEVNDDSIIVFESIDEPWHKIGWKSALIYAYDIAPRACTKKELPTIRKDTDHEVRSKDGIVFVRSLNKFIDRIQRLELGRYEKLEDGIYIFKVDRKYEPKDFKAFRNLKHKSGDELFAMGAAKKVYPELRGLIVKAEKAVFPKSAKMHVFYRDTLGREIVNRIRDMNVSYFELANGRGSKKEHLIKIVEDVNRILADLTIIQELEILNPLESVEIGSIMVDIKMSVRRVIDKTEA